MAYYIEYEKDGKSCLEFFSSSIAANEKLKVLKKQNKKIKVN